MAANLFTKKFLSKVDFTIFRKGEGGGGECAVQWELNVQGDCDGLDGFAITVPDQKITTSIWKYDEETDEEWQEPIVFEIKDAKALTCMKGGDARFNQLKPARLEIFNNDVKLVF